jgi:hypothetical protein
VKPGDIVRIIHNPRLENLGIGIILGLLGDSLVTYDVYWSGDGSKKGVYVGYLEVIS